jgi:hypothetical protein
LLGRGAFTGLANSAATFNLNYAGVANAITINKNASNTQATLTFGPTGQSRTFVGVNAADLQAQIDTFLRGHGGSDLKEFYKAINRLSLVAISDGNPGSTTARTDSYTFNRFGLGGDSIRTYRLDTPGFTSNIGFQFDFGVDGKGFEAGNFSGGSVSTDASVNFFYQDVVGVSLGSYFEYQDVESAGVYRWDTSLGIPVRPISHQGGTGLIWQATPWVSFDLNSSEDMDAGGSIWGVGFTNVFAWTPVEKFTIAAPVQISHYGGGSLKFGDHDEFDLNAGVNQSALKAGVRCTFRIGDSWSIYGGAVYSQYLDDAAVNNWISPEIGFGMTQKSGGGFRVGFTGDFGDNYHAYGARFSYKWAF